MKKKDAEKFAQRVNDVIEEELVACGFDREFVQKYLFMGRNKLIFLGTCKDLIELQNFKKKLGKISL